MEETGSRVVDSIQAASTADGIKGLERAVAPESSHPVRLLELWPTSTGWAFDASDLMVVRLLGHTVSLETCLAIAGDDGAHVRTIARHLRAVPNDRGACMADASTLLAMDFRSGPPPCLLEALDAPEALSQPIRHGRGPRALRSQASAVVPGISRPMRRTPD